MMRIVGRVDFSRFFFFLGERIFYAFWKRSFICLFLFFLIRVS